MPSETASSTTTLKKPTTQFYVDQPVAPGSYVKHADGTKSDKIPLLYQPFTIKDLTLANRLVVAPMCQYSSKDGFMGDYHLVHLGQFALHGAGLVLIEATAVEARGRISPDDTGIWSDEHIPGIKRVADFVHAHGSKIGIQLNHAGRKSSTPGYYVQFDPESLWPEDVVGPTGGMQWDEKHQIPHELTLEEIPKVVKSFGEAAVRAHKAGMDTVEIHAAHGYLLHQFLSPATNKRTDKYGGSIENRARLLLEVVEEVKANFPKEKPILVRISASDNIEHLDQPSFDIEQTVQVAKLLKEAGVDVLHVSSGGNVKEQKISYAPSYQVHFAERIKKEVPGLVVMAVGVITNGPQAESILEKGEADLIAVARGFLRDPALALRAARELGLQPRYTSQYDMFLSRFNF